MDPLYLTEKQLFGSMALGAVLAVFMVSAPEGVENGFEETRAAIEEVLECGGDNFSYVQARNLEYKQFEINEAVKLIIENSN